MNDNYLYTYKAKIIAIYDGDTVTATVDCGFKISFTEKFRLADIDAPEIRGVERPQGLKSRDALRERILDKEVVIKTIKDKKGKYGRYICTIFLDGENINAWLVNSGYAEEASY